MSSRALHWFRKGLRLHDNPALLEAANGASVLFPVFVIDPWFLKPSVVGVNRMKFLLETLEDLHQSLAALGSRLIVLRGKPEDVLPRFVAEHSINRVTFESDTEPYARSRDAKIRDILLSQSTATTATTTTTTTTTAGSSSSSSSIAATPPAPIQVISCVSHTLYDLDVLLKFCNGKPPMTYGKFLSLIAALGRPAEPLDAPSSLPPLATDIKREDYSIPTLAEINYPEPARELFVRGGETAGLARMWKYLAEKTRVANFSKPETSPTLFDEPSTTVLSPYLKFGALSPRRFFKELHIVYEQCKAHTQPPVSLLGQLYWREFFYLVGYGTPNFDKMVGNRICKQIPWTKNDAYLAAWEFGKTGFPWIDAVMNQLREVGWIHHLARHAVACFLTRGDLYLSWEDGRDVFDRYLLDSDWSLNNANWLWLSASAFFYAFFRVYSPISFAQKYDPEGKFIRRFVPALKDFPAKYIYSPWKAPLSVQQSAGCIIGKDYPLPIVDHEVVCKENMEKMKLAYAQQPDAAALMAVSAIALISDTRKHMQNNVSFTADSTNDSAAASTETALSKYSQPAEYKKINQTAVQLSSWAAASVEASQAYGTSAPAAAATTATDDSQPSAPNAGSSLGDACSDASSEFSSGLISPTPTRTTRLSVKPRSSRFDPAVLEMMASGHSDSVRLILPEAKASKSAERVKKEDASSVPAPAAPAASATVPRAKRTHKEANSGPAEDSSDDEANVRRTRARTTKSEPPPAPARSAKSKAAASSSRRSTSARKPRS